MKQTKAATDSTNGGIIETPMYKTIQYSGTKPISIGNEKTLKTHKIKSLNDVIRVLAFLDIKAIDDGTLKSKGYDSVRDLFED